MNRRVHPPSYPEIVSFGFICDGQRAEQQGAEAGLGLRFMYYTGCRKGATQQITWGMVSADCKEVALPGEITETPAAGPIMPLNAPIS